jgi:hypothetical protein
MKAFVSFSALCGEPLASLSRPSADYSFDQLVELLRVHALRQLGQSLYDGTIDYARFPPPRLPRSVEDLVGFNALLARASEDAGPCAEASTCVWDEALRQ